MEIATTMMSPSQMPQAWAETNPADETGGIQAKAAQSPRFGQLFDRWAGMAVGERMPAHSGSNKFTQAQLKGESSTERATDDAQDNDPSQGSLLKITDSFAAGLLTMAMAAPDKTVRKLPEQTVAGAGTSDPAAGPNPGENGVPATSTLQMLQGLQQKIAKDGNFEGITTAPCGLPIPTTEGGDSAGFPPTDNPREASKEKGGTDSTWAPLLTVGNLLGKGASAISLPESTGPVQQQGNTQPENNAGLSVPQPVGLLQAAAGQATGNFFQAPAVSLVAKDAGSLRASVTGIEAPSGNFGKLAESAMKTGADAVIPEAKGDIRASGDILSSRTKGTDSKAVDISMPKAGATSSEAEPSSRIQGRINSEAAGNAYRAAAADAALPGKNDVLSMSGNITQGKPLAIQDLSSANTGMDPARMEIVFAAAERENLKEPGSTVARKTGESKTADNTSTPVLVTNQAELRTTGESRMAAPSPDAKNPLGEQITNQIREKLDARGHASDNGQITLKLHPDDLGELKINMRMEDQRLKIEITTQNPSVKEALMQNLDSLKETLSRQNIAMDRFDVSADTRQGLHQGGGDGRQMTQENRGISTGFQHDAAIEDDAAPDLQYGWQNEESLVNLVL
jgi:flagellar hook-length control protein FliK